MSQTYILHYKYGVKALLKISIMKKIQQIWLVSKERNAIKYLKSEFPQADGKMISEIVKKYIV